MQNLDKTLNPRSLNFSLLKIEFAVQRFVTNCFLEPGSHVVFSVRFFRCPSKDVVTTNLPKRLATPLVPLTSFESLRVPAFPPNAILSATILALFFAVFWKPLLSQVASLPVKFVVGILFACRARSSYGQPYRQFLFDRRYGTMAEVRFSRR